MARLMALTAPRRRLFLTTSLLWLYLLQLLFKLLKRRHRPLIHRAPSECFVDRMLRGERKRALFMYDTTKLNDRVCLDTIRMNIHVFYRLCEVLVTEGGLVSTKKVPIDEMIVMFLWTIGHNIKNRIMQLRFGRSGKTVCAVIHAVLSVILKLHCTLYRKAIPIPEHCIHVNWKHFKNCLGALDGTHVKVRAIIADQPRYHNRKGEVSINVLAVCNPDCEFMYCLAGWEGSAHDGRVLRDALSRANGLRVPKGSYYLCDAGYANCEGFLTPFQGQRYHLKEWERNNRPTTPEEYYNMKHSSCRNVIERTFRLLKMRWAILRDTTWFSPDVAGRIVHAYCLLHNFIKRECGMDDLERAYLQSSFFESASGAEEVEEVSSTMQPTAEWSQFRNEKAQEMWRNRTRH